MAVTIHDLAKIAGLNASTISRALRGDERVKPATRRRIQELARQHGYSPNLPARQLARGKTGNLWFCFGSADSDIERQTAVRLNELFHRQGFDLLLVLHNNSPERFRQQLKKLYQQAADAAILIPPNDTNSCESLTELVNSLPVPHLFLDRYWEGVECPVVTTDNAAAARHLVDRCVEWGAGQFWLDFRSDNPVVRTRARAAEKRLAELGLPWAPFEERRQLPASAGPPAVVGNAARQEFTEFPEGPLFGAFFDFWENRTPGLYRKVIICRQNFARISEISAEMLRRLIVGETPAPAFIEIPPENYLEF